ncbi:glycoside hydrolase family 88 protein [Clostridium perfringens]
MIKNAILIIISAIVAIDIIPIFLKWVSRIHIGRYDDKLYWRDSLINVSEKWLNRTPKIKVTDNTRLVFIDMIKKKYTNAAIQNWQEAALLLGLIEYKKDNYNKNIEDEINKFINNKIDENGRWIKEPQNIDVAILAYAIMNVNNDVIKKCKPALDSTFNIIKNHIGEDGTVKYRKNMENYRYVDTVGFICAFLIKYGVEFNNNGAIDLAMKQINEYSVNGMLLEKGLPYHAYNVNTKEKLGLYGWGRGLGWYSIGIIDSWRELPDNNKYKNELNIYVKKFAKEVISLQNENGGWNWTTIRKETTTDSSTAATLSWFLINACEIKEISEECKKALDKSINYLMSVTRRSGAIDFSQGDTKDIGVYSMLFDILPFTQGFALRTICKQIRVGNINE